MSTTTAKLNSSTSDPELRAAARQAYRKSLAAQQPVTGTELGHRFGKSERWGRDRIREVRDEAGKNRDANGNSRDTDDSREALPVRRDMTPTVAQTPPTTGPDPLPDVAGKPTSSRPGRLSLDAVITVAVAVVAAAASYGHMLEVAMLAGEPLWIARAFPVTVDGLVLAAIRRGDDGRRWLALGAAVSVAANVLAQFPEHAATVGPVVSAWPPIALYGTHRLLHGRKDRSDR